MLENLRFLGCALLSCRKRIFKILSIVHILYSCSNWCRKSIWSGTSLDIAFHEVQQTAVCAQTLKFITMLNILKYIIIYVHKRYLRTKMHASNIFNVWMVSVGVSDVREERHWAKRQRKSREKFYHNESFSLKHFYWHAPPLRETKKRHVHPLLDKWQCPSLPVFEELQGGGG